LDEDVARQQTHFVFVFDACGRRKAMPGFCISDWFSTSAIGNLFTALSRAAWIVQYRWRAAKIHFIFNFYLYCKKTKCERCFSWL